MSFYGKLNFFNTLGHEKQIFKPINPSMVNVWCCGPTVYGAPHLGNARPAVIFDVLTRVLRVLYGKDHVRYARNFTDIDDKIIARAEHLGIDIHTLTTDIIEHYHNIEEQLNIIRPDVEPRATEHIPEMIQMVTTLIDNGHAYVSHGHVFFDVDSADFHGLLSGQDTNARKIGARIEPSEFKRNPADFVLWKPSTASMPGWDSPWGYGRPGWHLECSVMIRKHLGLTIDIHGGGQDLIFPHHENERSQSQCAHGVELSNYWIHNGMILADGKKMAKSMNNFVTVEDALAKAPGEAVRLLLMSTHYRKPLDWSWDRLTESVAVMNKFYRALQDTWNFDYRGAIPEYPAQVMEKLVDDLNTPDAIQVVHKMADNALNAKNAKERARLRVNLVGAGKLLGILQHTPEEWFHMGVDNPGEIDELVAKRDVFRQEKLWKESDLIRDDLLSRGIELIDQPTRTVWRKM